MTPLVAETLIPGALAAYPSVTFSLMTTSSAPWATAMS